MQNISNYKSTARFHAKKAAIAENVTRVFFALSVALGILGSFNGVLPNHILAYSAIGLGAGTIITNLGIGHRKKEEKLDAREQEQVKEPLLSGRAKQFIGFTLFSLALIALGLTARFDNIPKILIGNGPLIVNPIAICMIAIGVLSSVKWLWKFKTGFSTYQVVKRDPIYLDRQKALNSLRQDLKQCEQKDD